MVYTGRILINSKIFLVFSIIIVFMAYFVSSATPDPSQPANNNANPPSTNYSSNSTISTSNISDLIIPDIYYSSLQTAERDGYMVYTIK